MSEADSTAAPETLEDVEQTAADAEEKGYYGETPEYDRDAYTLKTGPESPSTIEATIAAKRAELEAQEHELTERAKGAKGKAKAGHDERKTARQSARKES
jgi:hypothetical protein